MNTQLKAGRPFLGTKVDTTRVEFKLPMKLAKLVAARAKKSGVTVSEWWREAAQAYLTKSDT